jgi:hypothetical protein
MFRVSNFKNNNSGSGSHAHALMTPQAAKNQVPFEFKGSLFTLMVMHLYGTDQSAIDRFLAEKVEQAPGFFNNTPVVIDLEALTGPDTAVDFAGLRDLLRRRGMVAVGVRNGSDTLRLAAVRAGLPTLPKGTGNGKPIPEPSTPPPAQHNKLVTQPLRSGQQIYAARGGPDFTGNDKSRRRNTRRWQYPCLRPAARPRPGWHQGRYENTNFLPKPGSRAGFNRWLL